MNSESHADDPQHTGSAPDRSAGADEHLDASLVAGDLDELLRVVDRRCDRNDWAGVQEIALRARAAIDRGHQLWPAASYAVHPLALHGPAELAASAVHDGAGWMAPGPLTEVVAQNHSFAELQHFLEHGPDRSVVAAERVLCVDGRTPRQPGVGTRCVRRRYPVPAHRGGFQRALTLSVTPVGALPHAHGDVCGTSGSEGRARRYGFDP